MTGGWEIALAGTALGIFGTWIIKVTDKCKCYTIKPSGTSCCGSYDFCEPCECGMGFTRKPLRPDGDADTELKISELNGVSIAYVNKRGNFVHSDSGSFSD
jgi:hypothetical protein